jgi:hypothetical protein
MLVLQKSGMAFTVESELDKSIRRLVLAGLMDAVDTEIRITERKGDTAIHIRAYQLYAGTDARPLRVSLGALIGGPEDLEQLKAEYLRHFSVPQGVKFVPDSLPAVNYRGISFHFCVKFVPDSLLAVNFTTPPDLSRFDGIEPHRDRFFRR